MKDRLLCLRNEIINTSENLADLDSSEIHIKLQTITAIIDDMLNDNKLFKGME